MEQTVQSTKQTNYIACLKWGDKYSADYVNKLYNMVQRNCTIPHEFICFTENSKGLQSGVRVESLPSLPTQGWWFKPYLLSNELPMQKGTLLFFDLDVVVFRNIDNLFTYKPDKFCIIRDFNRSIRKTWDRMNSSVFRTPIGKYHSCYTDFKNNIRLHTTKNRGDQDWMFRHIRDHEFWPDEWIMSYKWEMRDRNKLKLVNGKRNFIDTANPVVKDTTSVAVFHGDPNPADCNDPWVQKYWG